ncbi:hypothetical protein ACFQRK_17725 [Parapedobacter sp. GCM10030251]|uniref:hypothetical protein n=1 Tax=Parapedobacter sp. GCM10030251 TaxID=3273419 RepID=UPI0036169FE8
MDSITNYLDAEEPGFSYIRDDPRLEIWTKGKEWFPILISKHHGRGHLISWGEIELEIVDELKAYQYILRIIQYIKQIKDKGDR